jgi:small neutral amino acid transporter SnatA (MarC family)
MTEEQRTSSVSRKEFYASVGLLWLFLAFSEIGFFFLLPDDTIRRAGAGILFFLAVGMSIFNSIKALQQRSLPAKERDRPA